MAKFNGERVLYVVNFYIFLQFCYNLRQLKYFERFQGVLMKTILITGGAGFLGNHLCRKLLEQGHHIICLDNLSTGRERHIQDMLNHPRFKFINHDIEIPLNMSIDQIYNLACPASPLHYQKNPIKTTKTCVFGVINMLELAKNNNAKICHASTSEVYGNPKVHPQTEKYLGEVNPIGIRSCYDEGKRCAESLCFDYNRQHNIDVKVIRIFNTYGPNMDMFDGRVVSNFITQALQNQDITIYGDGTQTRSFCYVDDLIRGMIAMMNHPYHFNGPVNMGNPTEFTIIDFAQLIIKMTGSKSKIIFLPLPQDDPIQRKPDISLARQELDWFPRTSIEDGLKHTIHYFKKLLNI